MSSTYRIKRSDDEIDRVLNKVAAREEKGGSHYPGMSYEAGLEEGIKWAIGDYDEEPLCEIPEPENY